MNTRLWGGGVLLSLLLATASVADDTRWYVGAEVGSASNTFTFDHSTGGSVKDDSDYKDFKVFVGKGTGDNWYTQLYFSSITYDDIIFKDKKQTEFGLESIKKFDVTDQFSPFIKFGFGVGSMDLPEDYVDSNIMSYGVALGAGVDYKVLDQLSIIGGIDIGYRKWQDVEYEFMYYDCYYGYCYYSTDTITQEISATYQKFYVGANFRF